MKSTGKSLSSKLNESYNEMRQSASATFPKITPVKSAQDGQNSKLLKQPKGIETSPMREKNQFNRLSGLCDTDTSNGLYSEIVRYGLRSCRFIRS